MPTFGLTLAARPQVLPLVLFCQWLVFPSTVSPSLRLPNPAAWSSVPLCSLCVLPAPIESMTPWLKAARQMAVAGSHRQAWLVYFCLARLYMSLRAPPIPGGAQMCHI